MYYPVFFTIYHLTRPPPRIYASVNHLGIGSDNDLSPIRPDALI